MWFENGKWMMSEKEYMRTLLEYDNVMNDKSASEELKMMMEDFINSIEMAGI